MNVEIKATVTVRGNYGVDWITIEITEDDLIELAKNKALEMLDPSWYDEAECDEIDSISTTN